MPRWLIISIFVLIVAAALLGLWDSPGSYSDVFWQPLQSLAGSRRQLDATLLEASESAEPVRAASRRLLQPLGMVQLIRRYDSKDQKSKN